MGQLALGNGEIQKRELQHLHGLAGFRVTNSESTSGSSGWLKKYRCDWYIIFLIVSRSMKIYQWTNRLPHCLPDLFHFSLTDTISNQNLFIQRMRWLDSITDMDMNSSKLWETVKDMGAWRAAVHIVAKNWKWLTEQQKLGYLIFPI